MKQANKDRAWQTAVMICGIGLIVLTIVIGAFLIYRGSGTFLHGTSILEFLFSPDWKPSDTPGVYDGQVGAAIYIFGSLLTCALALLIALPLAIGSAIFMTEIAPGLGERILRPAIEIYVSIPSVVYGWVGLTVLVPFIRDIFHARMGGFSVLSASIVLAVMIFPTIATVAADALKAVPESYRRSAYGLGSTRWQVIHKIVLPAAKPGILVGVILGLARAIGEALAVAMVIGKTRAFPKDLLSPTSNLTAAIAADMGNTAEGGQHNLALWSMALLLFLLSMLFIFLIHRINAKEEKRA